jgi:hypothetical protein
MICRKEKKCARWFPHYLPAEQKQKRLEISTLLEQRFNVEGQAFLYRIVAIGETWVRDFEPKLKSQSNERRSTTSPRPKIFRQAQSKIKQLMIFVYDHQGISMKNFMWNRCDSSVLSSLDANISQKNTQKRPDLLGDGPLILHDSAHPHLGKVVTDLLSKYK